MRKYVLIAAILAGCSATTYQPRADAGGYEEQIIDADTYKVRFFANGWTGRGMAYDFAMLRSAELTIQSGFRYFTVTNWHDLSEQRISNSPATIEKTLYGTTEIKGGDSELIVLPAYELRIDMADEKGVEAFDALEVQRTVRQGYGIN